MAMFIVDDGHLARLTPATRRELLLVLAADAEEVRARYAASDWQPDGIQSYPLTVEEAELLVHGIPEPALAALKTFATNYDGKRGTATFKQLLEATGHTKVENIGRQISWIELRLRTVTANHDAWLVTWRQSDWKWDEKKQLYTRGKYFISGPAVESLRQVFGLD